MSAVSTKPLRIGVLGCGPIAQFAHFDACRKAKNAELYAICDVATDLLEAMSRIHAPRVVYSTLDAMLGDPRVDAIIVAVSDAFHVEATERAIAAGKHVLVEKPLGTDLAACRALRDHVRASGLFVQIGNNRRFDPGVEFAAKFVRDELGDLRALKAWYCDSTFRYTMTDNLQPLPVRSGAAIKPPGDPKADKFRYFLLTHGSHLVDTARYLGGPLRRVRARHLARDAAHHWFVDVDFESGALGHLDLSIPIQGDFQEGFQIWGERGSVIGRVHLPWFHKASDVECFSARDRQFHRPLGEDGYSYKRQVEGFAARIMEGETSPGATIDDGVAAMEALVAISRSCATCEWVALDETSGGV
jgi:predicted dehydrogenase